MKHHSQKNRWEPPNVRVTKCHPHRPSLGLRLWLPLGIWNAHPRPGFAWSRGVQDPCFPGFSEGRSIRAHPVRPCHLMEKVTIPRVKSDFSKAAQLGSRIAIVPIKPSRVRDGGSPVMLTSPEGLPGKSGKGPYLLTMQVIHAGHLFSQVRGRGCPKVRADPWDCRRLQRKHPPEKACRWADTCLGSFGTAHQEIEVSQEDCP